MVNFNFLKITQKRYTASQSQEIFIAAEDTDNDILIGFCRLRIPCKPFRPEITISSAGIRELHVYGKPVPLGSPAESSQLQHRGIGAALLAEAEKLAAEEFDARKMLVISGIGAREYYRKFGYRGDGVYMSKQFN